MSATTAIALAAFVLAVLSLGWQIFIWKSSHVFDVRVTVEEEAGVVGSGEYPIVVVARNHGQTTEAVQEVLLRFAEHPGADWSVRVRGEARELPPNRNARERIDLLASKFGIFPTELTAVVLLESGRHVASAPFRTSQARLASVLARAQERPTDGDNDPEWGF